MSDRSLRSLIGPLGCALLALGAFFGWLGVAFVPSSLRWPYYIVLFLFLFIIPKVAVPRVKAGYGHRARAAQYETGKIAALPGESPLGRCWQCGHKVAKGHTICPHCGAAQLKPSSRSMPEMTDTDLPLGTFQPTAPAPMYQPGMPAPYALESPPSPDASAPQPDTWQQSGEVSWSGQQDAGESD